MSTSSTPIDLLICAPSGIDLASVNSSIPQRLTQRTTNNLIYTRHEIEEIKTLRRAYFPKGYELSQKAVDSFRELIHFARVELQHPRFIASHRPIIGPVIVAIKKLLWPVFRLYLKDTLAGATEFNYRVISELARQHYELDSQLRSQTKTTKASE